MCRRGLGDLGKGHIYIGLNLRQGITGRGLLGGVKSDKASGISSETVSRGCGGVARLVLVGVGGETIGQVGADPLGADQSCINVLLAAEGISGVFRLIICDQLSSARASASGRIKSHSRLPR